MIRHYENVCMQFVFVWSRSKFDCFEIRRICGINSILTLTACAGVGQKYKKNLIYKYEKLF